MDAMNVFGAVTGIAVGVLQLVLLSAVSARITGVRKDGLSVGALAAIKLGVYLAASARLYCSSGTVFCPAGSVMPSVWRAPPFLRQFAAESDLCGMIRGDGKYSC